MPLEWTGQVTLQVSGDTKEVLVQSEDLELVRAGLRIIDDDEVRHEFVYRYDHPKFSLVLNATVESGDVEVAPPSLQPKLARAVGVRANTLDATFQHDPDTDDEPLTPVSSN